MHRVALEFFGCPVRVAQLEQFSLGGKHVHEFPELVDFVLRPSAQETVLAQINTVFVPRQHLG